MWILSLFWVGKVCTLMLGFCVLCEFVVYLQNLCSLLGNDDALQLHSCAVYGMDMQHHLSAVVHYKGFNTSIIDSLM